MKDLINNTDGCNIFVSRDSLNTTEMLKQFEKQLIVTERFYTYANMLELLSKTKDEKVEAKDCIPMINIEDITLLDFWKVIRTRKFKVCVTYALYIFQGKKGEIINGQSKSICDEDKLETYCKLIRLNNILTLKPMPVKTEITLPTEGLEIYMLFYQDNKMDDGLFETMKNTYRYQKMIRKLNL